MITLDTSGLIAYFATRDRHHQPVIAAMDREPGPYVLPVAVLAEMTFMIERDFPPDVEHAFLRDLKDERYRLYWSSGDLTRIEQLIRRYGDMPLGFADSAVVACAERHGGRVLSLDHRHFDVVSRGERTLTLLPGDGLAS